MTSFIRFVLLAVVVTGASACREGTESSDSKSVVAGSASAVDEFYRADDEKVYRTLCRGKEIEKCGPAGASVSLKDFEKAANFVYDTSGYNGWSTEWLNYYQKSIKSLEAAYKNSPSLMGKAMFFLKAQWYKLLMAGAADAKKKVDIYKSNILDDLQKKRTFTQYDLNTPEGAWWHVLLRTTFSYAMSLSQAKSSTLFDMALRTTISLDPKISGGTEVLHFYIGSSQPHALSYDEWKNIKTTEYCAIVHPSTLEGKPVKIPGRLSEKIVLSTYSLSPASPVNSVQWKDVKISGVSGFDFVCSAPDYERILAKDFVKSMQNWFNVSVSP